MVQVCRQLAINDQTCHEWRNEYGGMDVDQATRLKQLEQENSRLKRVVAVPRFRACRTNEG